MESVVKAQSQFFHCSGSTSLFCSIRVTRRGILDLQSSTRCLLMFTENDWRNLKTFIVLSFSAGSEALTISLAISLESESSSHINKSELSIGTF